MKINRIIQVEENSDASCNTDRFPKRFKRLFQYLKEHQISERVIFIVIGIASTVWFLIRVIPKPQRAAYPCMKVAAPLMSGFVLWILSATTAVISFKHAGRYFKESKFLFASLLILLSLSAGVSSLYFNSSNSFAVTRNLKSSYAANTPIGQAQGINPGRVVWVWNPDATNEDMTNGPFDYWYQNDNANQDVIDTMLVSGIRDLVGVSNAVAAWDSIFTWFNVKHGNGNHGYQQGEKIAIKLNFTNSSHPGNTLYGATQYPEYMDNTPETVFALLKQLINVYNVNQSDIYIGDNFRAFRNTYWNLCHTAFPDVHYVDGSGTDGREKTQKSSSAVLHFSDGSIDLCIPKHFVDATYLINMAALKTHDAAGITLTAKNHQGSIIKPDEDVKWNLSVYSYAHGSLPDKVDGYGHYRHLVDYMGHKDMGEKTVLFMVDGIWSGREFWGKIFKWDMSPFNGDYPSSIFLSQDAVAIESVVYDFLLEEFRNKPAEDQFPYMSGTDDYLFQAADASYWPDGIEYDPEDDGTVIGSLGVYEHWNNPISKQYTRNLNTGDGIELIKTFPGVGTAINSNIQNGISTVNIYPNPVADIATISASGRWTGDVTFRVFDISGKLVYIHKSVKNGDTLNVTMNLSGLTKGIYVVDMEYSGKHITKKITCR